MPSTTNTSSKTISLVMVPGAGLRHVTVQNGTTLAQFAADHGLSGRQLIVNGESMGTGGPDWGVKTLDSADEVFAVTSLKGN